MLVCVTVAVLVLSGASVNADRSRREAAEQQGYFALNSALDEAKNMWTTEDPLDALEVTVDGTSVSVAPSNYSSSAVASWAATSVGKWASGNYVAGGWSAGKYVASADDLTVTVTGTNPSTKQALPDVTLIYSMNSGYAITIYGTVDAASGYAQWLTTTVEATTNTTSPVTVNWKKQS